MKVCHITSAHNYNDTRIFLKECQTLVSEGFEVFLVAPNAPDIEEKGVKIRGVSVETKSRAKRFTKTVQKVYKKAISIDADLYHFHDPELIPVGIRLKAIGKMVIYDIHEDVPRQILSKYWIKKPLRKLVSGVFERFENYGVKKFDACVTATPFINERFIKLGCNSVNVNNFPIQTELFSEKFDWMNKDNAVCFIGGINKVRGIYEMLSAIGELDNITLYLGGKFLSNDLKEDVMKLEGWGNVDNLGFLSRDEVANLLSKTMAGLVLFHPEPNHVNAQPNKMFEYMSAGIPVISSNFPLWKEIIEKNNCGLCVNPLDPGEIANAIQWIVEHPTDAEKMGDNARKAIEEKYNWEIESRKLVNLYNTLASITAKS